MDVALVPRNRESWYTLASFELCDGQFELIKLRDAFRCHWPLQLIIFLIDYFLLLTSLSRFWTSLNYLHTYCTLNFVVLLMFKFWCDLLGVHKFDFCCFMEYWNGNNPPYLIGREVSSIDSIAFWYSLLPITAPRCPFSLVVIFPNKSCASISFFPLILNKIL